MRSAGRVIAWADGHAGSASFIPPEPGSTSNLVVNCQSRCRDATGTGQEAVARGTASEAAPYVEWTQGSGMSECLHCEINQLVQERMESGHADLTEIASMMVESLADLIVLAPESEQPKLIAYALSAFGQMLLEKSEAAEEGSTATH
jgi:hypothetical protein